MKNATTMIMFVLLSSALGFSETPAQLGGWSVYLASNQVVLLQSASEEQYKGPGDNQVPAKLDLICKKGKLSAIALEPGVTVKRSAMSFAGPVPTTRVNLSTDGRISHSENWVVLDGGRTLSPNSELLQRKLMRYWAERIAGTQKTVVQVDGQSEAQSSFATGELTEALASVGCSY
jgi:hypothetical protein